MKKIISLLLICTLTLGFGTLHNFSAKATTLREGYFDYRYINSGNEVELIKYYNNADVVIPAVINGKPVTSIADDTFDYSFVTNSALTLTIPGSIKNFDVAAFSGAEKLQWIKVDSSNQYFKSIDGVVYDKSGKTLLVYPSGKSGTSFTVPNGIEVISNSSFMMNQNLASITFPSSLRTINDWAFYYSNLQTVNISTGLTTIKDGAFRCSTKLSTITIPSTVKSIGLQAFADCHALQKLTVPSSVTTFASSDIFSNTPVTLYVEENSAAHKYAVKENVKFVLIKAPDTPTTTTTAKKPATPTDSVTTEKNSTTTSTTDTSISDTTTDTKTDSTTDNTTVTTTSAPDETALSTSDTVSSQDNSVVEASKDNDSNNSNLLVIIILAVVLLAGGGITVIILVLKKKAIK